MAHYSKKHGIVLDKDDRESLSRTKKLDTEKIINWLIWGNPEGKLTFKKYGNIRTDK